MLSVNNLSKQILRGKSSISILNNISFNVEKQEVVSLFGPNGCGKSTLLKIISGIENHTNGSFQIQSSYIKARIGYVFQNADDSMMPWKTIAENITFGLISQNIDQKKKKLLVENLLKKVNLYKEKDEYFCNVSGGMKQLVAICRSIAFKPDILLLDEPFSSLDYFTTKKIQLFLMELLENTKLATLLVSHDIDEAIYLSDRVVVLSHKPTHIKGIVNIDLPRPRGVNCLKSNSFFKAKNKILDLISYE